MSKEHFNNREISWLKFNERVMYEAIDMNNPIMERIKFLAISASNLDEFFMIRVAGLKNQLSLGYNEKDMSSKTPKEQINEITAYVKKLYNEQEKILDDIKKELITHNILMYYDQDEEILEIMENIFINDIMPILSPITLDPSHPFPFIFNKRFSMVLKISRGNKEYLSLIMIPENINRVYRVKKSNNKIIVLKIEDIISSNVSLLYRGYKVLSVDHLRVTRNADVDVQKEEAYDLLRSIEDSVSRRDKGSIARIEISSGIDKETLEVLKSQIVFNDEDIFNIDGDIDLTYLFQLCNLLPDKQFKPLTPFMIDSIPNNKDIFEYIKKKDIFFIRPYYSFSMVSNLIAIASTDKDVLAIKMTLYRTNTDSKILTSLIEAANRGKQVSVVVELTARFDEKVNITWAKNLEQAGCIVSYGIPDLKVHAKAMLIIRREESCIKRYTHIATGNYNENTAMVYTDIDLITANDDMGKDISELFNYLMSYTSIHRWSSLFIAPFTLKSRIYELVDTVTEDTANGQKGMIVMKMNSLVDKDMISKLYKASEAGVTVRLIVRGICCLKPGIKGLSSNITVTSIVGRFLEHPRIFYFKSKSLDKVFISSADIMPRNLNGRVEVMAEIIEKSCRKNLLDYIEISLKDNVKSWALNGDTYKKVTSKGKAINSQNYFLENRIIE